MTKCEICRTYKAKYKDYRFIDSCGLQGKVLVCSWCFRLNDIAIREIVRSNGSINPKKTYYVEVKDLSRADRSNFRSGFPYKGLNDERYIEDRDETFKHNGNGWWWGDGWWNGENATPAERQRRYRKKLRTVRERCVANV
jgi:hypothetical protein|tara:strand:+ start:710 stop:1129 length:420 start_codon:yes stop_codon:yes gene_type:complete